MALRTVSTDGAGLSWKATDFQADKRQDPRLTKSKSLVSFDALVFLSIHESANTDFCNAQLPIAPSTGTNFSVGVKAAGHVTVGDMAAGHTDAHCAVKRIHYAPVANNDM